MTIIFAILLIGAAVCFAVATAQISARVNLLALGLLLWVLVPLIQTLQRI